MEESEARVYRPDTAGPLLVWDDWRPSMISIRDAYGGEFDILLPREEAIDWLAENGYRHVSTSVGTFVRLDIDLTRIFEGLWVNA